MKAVVYTKYGTPEVLQLKDIEKPVPRDNELLVKVYATTVNRTDNATIRGIPFFARIVTGLLKPKKKIPGTEFAGTVEAVGSHVSTLKVGDKVFGFNDVGSCSHAEFITIAEDNAISMPGNITYEQAAASTEGAHYAYNFINKITLEKGQNVLVNGATGAIGSAAVQLLKYFGANVTAVCGAGSSELVKSLGADKVIDYTREDFTREHFVSDDQKYHYVFDTVGKSSFFKCYKLLQPGGIYISSDLGYLSQNIFLPMITPLFKSLLKNKKTVFPFPVNIRATLLLVKKLIEEGKFKPMIDKTYPFEQIIDAYGYVGKGHKKGNVVIIMEKNN